jgi:hypothetical protein
VAYENGYVSGPAYLRARTAVVFSGYAPLRCRIDHRESDTKPALVIHDVGASGPKPGD